MAVFLTLPYHPLRFPFHTLRRLLVQPFFWAFFFLMPVLHVFQMDVIHNRLILWGKTYPLGYDTLWWLPISFFACVLLIAISSTLTGRVFCGWMCPHNTMTEWTQTLRTWIGLGPRPYRLRLLETRWPWLRPFRVGLALIWALAITTLISVLFLLYFVPLPWYLHHVQAGTLPVILGSGQAILIAIGLFMIFSGHEFCRSACPYGISQSLSAYLTGKWTPMEIRHQDGLDWGACKSCRACESICPVDIDPRDPKSLVVGVGEGCFNCGECIDACHYVRSAQDKVTLLFFQRPQFHAGETGEARELAE